MLLIDYTNLNFVITNITNSENELKQLRNYSNLQLDQEKNSEYRYESFVFGYVFCKNKIFKNEKISLEDYQYLKDNLSYCSGLFLIIYSDREHSEVIVDPLCQYPIFYKFKQKEFIISTDLYAINNVIKCNTFDTEFLFDYLVTQSPLRNKSILKEVSSLSLNDFTRFSNEARKFGVEFIHYSQAINNDNSFKDSLEIFKNNLNDKISLLSQNIQDFYLSLTGGLDSRIVFSALLNNIEKERIHTFSFGDGTSQDKLISLILSRYNNSNSLRNKRDEYLADWDCSS